MPKVIIPSPFRKYTSNQREVIIHGNNLKETMEHLLQQYPGLKIVNHDSTLLSIFINSKLIRTEIDKWDMFFLNNKDEITLITSIAGG